MFYKVLMVFPFPFPPLVVTEVHGRTFGVWTLLTCTLCFLCAFNLENKPLYLATFLSFIYAFGHFLTEYLIYHTMAIANLTTVGIFAGMNVNGLICCRISLMSLLPFALYVGWSCLVIFLDSWHNFHVYFPFFWGGGLGMWSIFPYGEKKGDQERMSPTGVRKARSLFHLLKPLSLCNDHFIYFILYSCWTSNTSGQP